MQDNSSRTSLAHSISASKHSHLSRTQSLIKRNIESHDLVPSDVLIERFVAWKAIVKQLIAYFEGVADVQNNTAREMSKLAGVIQVPFRSGNQFLGEGGLQDVYYAIRDKTRVIADHHADLGRTIDSSIVQHLQKLRTEIKAHIKNIQNDTGKLASNVAKEREHSTKLIGELANDISSFKNTPMNVTSRTDPYVANLHVAHQLQKQVLEENLLQKSIIMMQQNSAHFEEGIVRSIQSAWVTFDEWQSRAAASTQDTFRVLHNQMAALQPDKEWISFAARSDHLLDPDTPLRNPESIQYPLKDDPSVIPVHTGYLERKQRFTRAYKEGYFVLTPAGFLHSFASSNLAGNSTPTFSLFLPLCTLGPPSTPSSKSHKFHIEGKKDGLGTTKAGTSIKSMFSRDSQRAWSFRARSREELMEWWNDVRMLCARYLVASEMMERTGPVEAAVRAVGYDEEEEEEEEWDGSSVEEEAAEDDGEEDVYEDVMEDGPPGYSHPAHHEKAYAGEVNQNGYLVDKKVLPGHYPEEPQQAGGGGVTRRPSKRQQEKAPEGRAPHVYPDHDEPVIDRNGGAGVNSPPGDAPGPSTTTYQAVPVSARNANTSGHHESGDASHIVDLGPPNGSANGSARGSVGDGEGMKPVSAHPTGNTEAGPAPVESRFQEGL